MTKVSLLHVRKETCHETTLHAVHAKNYCQHAEIATVLPEGKEYWYLPSFGIYHPKKPEQIRIVFDSSAQHEGISLNNVLLKGPDLNNLLGVLIRFRKEIAVTADIQHMYYCFVVKEKHRDHLRFLWFWDNELNSDIVDYRMQMQRYLQDQQCTWIFIPLHSSHMGGAWERLIDVARRILDSMFPQERFSSLTHEVLITLMAEVCAIINARPLLPVPTDPESPLILILSMLLSQKTGTPSSPPSDFGKAEILRQQWKQVQHLAETF
ncbi:hypothetical protein N1851_005228 [Merluccius polli]|uniref:Uncharacterized protein n=1 Tax=Merluccius polli TaxID=89951 RepID=A0AA47N784_MERPO|nr:hypothetical protein N1851_005228 [Merluccius polli]